MEKTIEIKAPTRNTHFYTINSRPDGGEVNRIFSYYELKKVL